MQDRFRIQSFSSQSPSHPITNLLAKHSPWQSERFCDYPQQITLAFYHPVRIHAIRIAAHPTKIPSRINILYYLPTVQEDRGFAKYGFVTFSEGDPAASNPVQVKELTDVGVDALEVRFLLLRNHMNKHNFFNQVALSSLSFTTSPCDHVLPPPAPTPSLARSALLSLQPQVSLFQQLKANFIRREQFQEAKQVKQILGVLERAGSRLQALQEEKQRLVKGQDFMGAKKTKEEMLEYKQEITELLTNFYDPDKKVLRSVKSDQKLRRKVQELNLMKNSSVLSDGSQPHTPRKSRIKEDQPDVLRQQMETVSEGEQEQQGQGQQRNESMISHEERILPAVMSRIKGMGQTQPIPESSEIADNQFFESGENNALPAQPQPMGPADQANSSLLTQFYDQTFIRKLHSKHWQFRLQAITQVLSEAKQLGSAPSPAPIEKNRLRCFLFIYSVSLKSHNFQIASATLQTMNQLAPLKSQGDYKGQLHNELEQALRGTVRKLADSNQKVRSMAQKTILRIIDSPLFGVTLCYSSLIKAYPQKTTPKIRKIKIEQIEYMVQRYGVGEGGVPYSVAEFANRAAGDPDADVRKSAAGLSKTIKEKGGKQRLENLIMGSSNVLKPSPKKATL